MKPDYTNEAVLLALRQLEGSHSSENIAIAVVETLQIYEVY
jgi:methyltransferase-like protein